MDTTNNKTKGGKKVLISGILKDGNVIKPKLSVNGDEYVSLLMEIGEIREENDLYSNNDDKQLAKEHSTVRAIFWKKDFDTKTYQNINFLKDGQSLVVMGWLTLPRGDFTTPLIRVLTIETDSEIFV